MTLHKSYDLIAYFHLSLILMLPDDSIIRNVVFFRMIYIMPSEMKQFSCWNKWEWSKLNCVFLHCLLTKKLKKRCFYAKVRILKKFDWKPIVNWYFIKIYDIHVNIKWTEHNSIGIFQMEFINQWRNGNLFLVFHVCFSHTTECSNEWEKWTYLNHHSSICFALVN